MNLNKDLYLILSAFSFFIYRWLYPQSYIVEFMFCILIALYLLYLIIINRKDVDKFYNIKEFAYTLQLLTILIITMIQIELLLRIMLVFGYFMLFIQKRWHKHLYIMLIMVLIIFVATGGLSPVIAKV